MSERQEKKVKKRRVEQSESASEKCVCMCVLRACERSVRASGFLSPSPSDISVSIFDSTGE